MATFNDLPTEIIDEIAACLIYPCNREALINLGSTCRRCRESAAPCIDLIPPPDDDSWETLLGWIEDPDDYDAEVLAEYQDYLKVSAQRLPQIKYYELGKQYDFDYRMEDLQQMLEHIPNLHVISASVRNAGLETLLRLHPTAILDLEYSPGFEETCYDDRDEDDLYGDAFRPNGLFARLIDSRIRSLKLCLSDINLQNGQLPWLGPVRRLLVQPPTSLSMLHIKISSDTFTIPSFQLEDLPSTSSNLEDLVYHHVPCHLSEGSPLPLSNMQWLTQNVDLHKLRRLHLKAIFDQPAIECLTRIHFPWVRSFGIILDTELNATEVKSIILNMPALDDLRLWHGMSEAVGEALVPHFPRSLARLDLSCECKRYSTHPSKVATSSLLKDIRRACPELVALSAAIWRHEEPIIPLKDWKSLRTVRLQLVTPADMFTGICPCREADLGTDRCMEVLHEAAHMLVVDVSLVVRIYRTIFGDDKNGRPAMLGRKLDLAHEISGGSIYEIVNHSGCSKESSEETRATLDHISRPYSLHGCDLDKVRALRRAGKCNYSLGGTWPPATATFVESFMKSAWPETRIKLYTSGECLAADRWEDVFTSMNPKLLKQRATQLARSKASPEPQSTS